MKYIFPSIIILSCIFIFSCSNSKNKANKIINSTSISAKALKALIDSKENIYVIDVRSKDEYFGKVGHIDGSKLIPLQTIANSITNLKDLKETIYVVCLSGKRSGIAAKILTDNGITALNKAGGMLAWNKLK